MSIEAEITLLNIKPGNPAELRGISHLYNLPIYLTYLFTEPWELLRSEQLLVLEIVEKSPQYI